MLPFGISSQTLARTPSGRVPYRRRLPDCDLAIVFNGAHPAYETSLDRLDRRGVRRLYVELGWFPQSATFQIDSQGINSAASWPSKPLTQTPQRRLELRSSGDLLVLLQDDEDTQIRQRSPWFSNMYEFLQHILHHSDLPVRVRPHPRHPASADAASLIKYSDCRIDQSASLSAALKNCRAVACINSSGAVEALAHHIPVLCYGKAIYRHVGVVHCLKHDAQATRMVTKRLAAGNSELFCNLIDEFLGRVQIQQWTVASISRRLPRLLGEVLGDDQQIGRKKFNSRFSKAS